MQLAVILAVLGLANIIGVGVMSENDLAKRGVSNAEYRASVEVEDVTPEERPSLMGELSH